MKVLPDEGIQSFCLESFGGRGDFRLRQVLTSFKSPTQKPRPPQNRDHKGNKRRTWCKKAISTDIQHGFS